MRWIARWQARGLRRAEAAPSASSFVFANGHTEAHKWVGNLFRKLTVTVVTPAPNDEDAKWLMQHTTKPFAMDWP